MSQIKFQVRERLYHSRFKTSASTPISADAEDKPIPVIDTFIRADLGMNKKVKRNRKHLRVPKHEEEKSLIRAVRAHLHLRSCRGLDPDGPCLFSGLIVVALGLYDSQDSNCPYPSCGWNREQSNGAGASSAAPYLFGSGSLVALTLAVHGRGRIPHVCGNDITAPYAHVAM